MVIIKQLNLPLKYIEISFAPSVHVFLTSGLQFINTGFVFKSAVSPGVEKKSDLQNEHGNVTMGFFPLFKV